MHGKDDGSRRFAAGADSDAKREPKPSEGRRVLSGPAPAATPMRPMLADDSSTPAGGRRAPRPGRGSREDMLDAFSEDADHSPSLSQSGSQAKGRSSASRASPSDARVADIDIEPVSGATDWNDPDPARLADGAELATVGQGPRPRPPPLPAVPPGADPATTLPPVSLNDPRLGETLNGRYKLEKLIGKGGMGRVYRAIQSPLNRPVALKILNPEFQKKDPQFVRRFFLEAATAARLTHPNTITVFDYGEAESGELFIVMEYLRGRPLSRVIATEGPFSAERTMHIAIQICRALREAHTKGIIHRDLKPGNILLLEEGDDADFVKVLDFGLVKLFTPPASENALRDSQEPLTPGPNIEGELTRAGMFLGSPKYMSPEQIQGQPLDPRTDIYSLGVLMFQMLAGKPPYNGATSVEVIYKHVNQPVPRVSDVTPGVHVPDELELIVQKCLAKSREDRFASMADLLVRLKDVKRLVTGVSAASEIGVSLQALMAAHAGAASIIPAEVARAAATGDLPTASQGPRSGRVQLTGDPLSVSGAAISRATIASSQPSQRPAPPSQRPAPTLPDPVKPGQALGASREAAFSEIGEEDTPSALVRERGQGRDGANRLNRIAPILAGSALVVVLGVAAYVLSSNPRGVAKPSGLVAPEAARDLGAPGARGEITDVRVAFASTPAGAEVFDEDGARLGTTPLTRTLKLPRGDKTPRRFVFKLEGYLDEIAEEPLDGPSPELRVVLRAEPEGAGRDEAPSGTVRKEAPSHVDKEPVESPRSVEPVRRPKPTKVNKGGDADYKDNPY